MGGSVYSRHLSEGNSPPPEKKLTIPPKTAAKVCDLNVFLWPGQIITNISQKLSLNGQ